MFSNNLLIISTFTYILDIKTVEIISMDLYEKNN